MGFHFTIATTFTNQPLHTVLGTLAILLSTLMVGCAVPPPSLPKTGDDELKRMMTEFARQAVAARQQLAAAKLSQEQIKQADPRGGSATLDVDFVGPIESILQAVTTKAGWKFQVLGKKRDDILVTLYHVRVPPVVIMQDVGEQCGSRCDVHVELMPNGVSEVALIYR